MSQYVLEYEDVLYGPFNTFQEGIEFLNANSISLAGSGIEVIEVLPTEMFPNANNQ